MQACCPFCGISFTNFEFHLNLHEDCKLMDGQSEQVGERREEESEEEEEEEEQQQQQQSSRAGE